MIQPGAFNTPTHPRPTHGAAINYVRTHFAWTRPIDFDSLRICGVRPHPEESSVTQVRFLFADDKHPGERMTPDYTFDVWIEAPELREPYLYGEW